MEEQVMNLEAIQTALSSGLSTTVNEYYVPSVGRTVGFKPLLTAQCKTLAKMLIEADEKPFDTFKITVGMIRETCLEVDLDINKLTEIDRIKLLMEFYRTNNIIKDFNIECPHCKGQTKIHVDLDSIIDVFDNADLTEMNFDNHQDNRLTAVVSLPTLVTMYQFYELLQNNKVEMDDLMKCFISEFNLVFKNQDITPVDIKISTFSELIEYLNTIDLIPYTTWADEDTESNDSIFDIIMNKLDNTMGKTDNDQICDLCGESIGEVASAQNFI